MQGSPRLVFRQRTGGEELQPRPFLGFLESRQGNSGGLASLDNLGSLGYRHGPWLLGPWPG